MKFEVETKYNLGDKVYGLTTYEQNRPISIYGEIRSIVVAEVIDNVRKLVLDNAITKDISIRYTLEYGSTCDCCKRLTKPIEEEYIYNNNDELLKILYGDKSTISCIH